MKLHQRAFIVARMARMLLCGALRAHFFAAFIFWLFSFSAAVSALPSGGPDTFGYKWKDSDESGGPAFSYIDVSTSGVPVAGFADDNFLGPFPIGFTFNFYGAGYTEFYIASNGFIGFGPTTGYHKFTNVQPPITTSPNNIIAWLWDDLVPRDDTGVYYQNFSDKLVIQFVRFGNNNSGYDNERVDAEVILYPSGRILVQYLSFTSGWPFNLATVGLENADGTDGLTVVYNAAYLHDALAVQFTNGAIAPEPPALLLPSDGATEQPTTVTLQWNASDDATSYRLQVATDAAFANKVFDDSTLTTASQVIGPLANFTIYYWRAKAKNAQGASAWSPFWKFTTKDLAQIGAPIQTLTRFGFLKSNQSKVFYYDSQWWALACNQSDLRWYIWRYNRGTSWAKTISIMPGKAFQCDVVVDDTNGKLYILGSHYKNSYFVRLSYIGGTWKKDPGYPVILTDFINPDQNNPISLVRAKNSHLWIFRIHNKILQAKRSTNDGKDWSATINIKSGLTTIYGTTDAAAFTVNGTNFVGVAYGERDAVGSKFGFLRHRDIDPQTVWTDESSSLTFFGNERALNNICLSKDGNNNLYLMTNNNNVGGSLPRNTLYKRTNAGTWEKFKINSNGLANWKSPALAIDQSNNRIYCMGVNKATAIAEFKTCLIGEEATLDTAAVQTLFYATGASFENISAPPPQNGVTGPSGLMVCGENRTANDIWFRHLPIDNPPPVTIGAVTVDSDEVNANATYTIPLTLSAAGALSANSGTLHFRFLSNTYVPDTMPASQVLVDGVPAAKVVANNAMKQVSITVPVNLSNNQSFFVEFNPGTGMLNPTTVDGYQLTAWTSAQPMQVSSSSYNLVPATTTVTPAAVTLSTTNVGTPADYTISFNLGDHGRMIAGAGAFTLKFGNGTTIKNGPLSGVKVNNVNAFATGDNSQGTIAITLPTQVPLGNNAAVTLFLPKPAITNPILSGNYSLAIATSVETTPVVSHQYVIPFVAGRPLTGTTKHFDRANQSKMFYHDGNWWVTAQAKDDLKWYLWKFDGAAWRRTIQIYGSAKPRPDCVLEPALNKVFILLPGGSTTYILRLSYAFGNWAIDNGYPYAINDFAQNAEINLLRATNGNLWIFMIENSSLVAKRSSNGGQTWSATITVKSNLNKSSGLTDAVKFVYNGANYIGVGYAENSTTGSIYGFLRHKDSDPETVWIDETSEIPQFSGTFSDNHISMLSYNNNVLMIVKTNGGGPTTTTIGLLRRDPNGAWFQYPILLSQGWTRPTLAIDQTHSRLYVIGTRENGVKVGEMKSVAFGDFSGLLTAPIDTIFSSDTDNFFDTSVAAHPVDGVMNLLICNGNDTRDELWFNLINLSGVSKTANDELAIKAVGEEKNFDGVQVYPNPFNPETFFRFKVSEPARVKLHIFNLGGQLVRALVDDELPTGVHQKRWNGRNDAGYRAASGVYLYRLQVGERVYDGRVQMIK